MEFSMAETGEPQRPIGISAIQAGEVNLGVSGFRFSFNRMTSWHLLLFAGGKCRAGFNLAGRLGDFMRNIIYWIHRRIFSRPTPENFS
jgi:hypothetical protein